MIWCLHGAVGQSSDWADFSQRLAEKGQACRAVELWRFLECEGIGLAEWAAVFNAEVKAAGAEKNILVGYSMGGRLALHALLDSPELWEKTVIVSAHPGLMNDADKLERMASDAEWAGLALTSDWSQFLQKWDAQGVLQSDETTSPDPRMKLVNRRRAIARSFMEWSLGKQADLRVGLSKLDCSALWLTGGKDEKFSRLASEFIDAQSGFEHQIFAESGHRLPWEAKEEFYQVVNSWIEG